jgi:hypothetical protein
MARWRDRAVQVDPSTLNRASVDAFAAYAVELGYKVRETNLLDIDGTVMVCVEGYGEDYEAYFRPNLTTGYLRFDYGNRLSSYSADRIATMKAIRSALAAIRDTAIEMGWGS